MRPLPFLLIAAAAAPHLQCPHELGCAARLKLQLKSSTPVSPPLTPASDSWTDADSSGNTDLTSEHLVEISRKLEELIRSHNKCDIYRVWASRKPAMRKFESMLSNLRGSREKQPDVKPQLDEDAASNPSRQAERQARRQARQDRKRQKLERRMQAHYRRASSSYTEMQIRETAWSFFVLGQSQALYKEDWFWEKMLDQSDVQSLIDSWTKPSAENNRLRKNSPLKKIARTKMFKQAVVDGVQIPQAVLKWHKLYGADEATTAAAAASSISEDQRQNPFDTHKMIRSMPATRILRCADPEIDADSELVLKTLDAPQGNGKAPGQSKAKRHTRRGVFFQQVSEPDVVQTALQIDAQESDGSWGAPRKLEPEETLEMLLGQFDSFDEVEMNPSSAGPLSVATATAASAAQRVAVPVTPSDQGSSRRRRVAAA